QLLRAAAEVAHDPDDILRPGLIAQAEVDRLQVAVAHRYAVALRADADRGVAEGVAVPVSEQLARLALDLLLFAADIGHDIVDQVERRHARVAGRGAGLQRGDEAALDPERVPERLERQHKVDRRAVR